MPPISQLPLADLGEVLKNLAPIIFVVLYGVAHLVGNLQQEKKKAGPPRARPVPPPQDVGAGARNVFPGNAGGAEGGDAPARAGGGNAPTLEESLRREVEEFLRRAQGQPLQPKRAGASPPPASSAPQRPARQTARGSNRTPEQRPQPPRRLVDSPRPESTAPPAPLGAGVAAHAQSVTQHAQSVAQHAQSLGADLAQTDERMQEHLRQKFAHQVGALSPTTSVQRQATGSPAARDLRDLLSRPGGIQQLIIANEILRRPEERWDD